MILESKPLSKRNFRLLYWFLSLLFKGYFKKIIIKECSIREGQSYLLLCNHFSFWDGFWGAYLMHRVFQRRNLMRKVYTLTLKKQMENHPWLQYLGCFSIDPGKPTVIESIRYARKVIQTPGNILLVFPQGKLESSHVRTLQLEKGISSIASKVHSPCQIIWCSNITEYFESSKPTLYMNLLDCGSVQDFNFEKLNREINLFHQNKLDEQIRNRL